MYMYIVHVHCVYTVPQVVSERHLTQYVMECLSGENVEVKIAACKCLHSLSRSTKLLRTTIIDTEAWKHVLEVHVHCNVQYVYMYRYVHCTFVHVHVYPIMYMYMYMYMQLTSILYS